MCNIFIFYYYLIFKENSQRLVQQCMKTLTKSSFLCLGINYEPVQMAFQSTENLSSLK